MAEQLFDEYAARLARGEVPDPRPYLERAGDRADELREMLDALLAAAPAPPAPEARAAMRAARRAGAPPLLELRRRRGRRREAVVEAIMERFGLGEAARAKVASYYHRLESGLLDLARVDQGVLATIASALGVDRGEIVAGRPLAPAAGAMLRSPEPGAPAAPITRAGWEPPAEYDEVDRLFLGERRPPAG